MQVLETYVFILTNLRILKSHGKQPVGYHIPPDLLIDARFFLCESNNSLCYSNVGDRHNKPKKTGKIEPVGVTFFSILLGSRQQCRTRRTFVPSRPIKQHVSARLLFLSRRVPATL